MAFDSHSIQLKDGTRVSPPELTYNQLSDSQFIHYAQTVKRWLHLESTSVSWNEETQGALDTFRSQKGLENPPQKVTEAVWDALEENHALQDKRSKDKQYYAPVTTFPYTTAELTQSLETIGIQVTDESQLPQGVQLFQGLLHRVHLLEVLKEGKPFHLYPGFRKPQIKVSASVWRGFLQSWSEMTGAPWWGFVCLSQEKSVHWAASELHRIVQELGANYFKELADATSVEQALDHPLKISYTAFPLGGSIADREDFSQVGLHAALELPEWSQAQQIAAISKALVTVHPAWRIRYTRVAGAPITAPWYPVEEEIASAVLEMDPDFEKLIYSPGRVPAQLNRKPELLNRFPSHFIAKELAFRMSIITAVELEAFFEGLREKLPDEVMSFLFALREAKGLSTMLEIIQESEKDFLDVLLGVDLSALPISGLSDKMREWQQMIIDLLYIYRLTTDFSEAFSAEAITSKVKYYSNHNPFD